jgi:hypothetical protein
MSTVGKTKELTPAQEAQIFFKRNYCDPSEVRDNIDQLLSVMDFALTGLVDQPLESEASLGFVKLVHLIQHLNKIAPQ